MKATQVRASERYGKSRAFRTSVGILRLHLRDEPGGNGNHNKADDVMDVFFSPRVHSVAAAEHSGSEADDAQSVQHRELLHQCRITFVLSHHITIYYLPGIGGTTLMQ